MNREIKFRVWCETEIGNQMVYLDDGEFDNGYWFSCPAKISHIDKYLSGLMQFTGLKDKNGKEIYEGDILAQDCRMANDYTGKESIEVQKLPVRWDNEKAEWSVYCPSAMIKDNWGHVPRNAYVIGNIYEHPELLNQQATT